MDLFSSLVIILLFVYFPCSYCIYTGRIFQVRGGQSLKSDDQKASQVQIKKQSIFHGNKESLIKKKSRRRMKSVMQHHTRRKPPSLGRMFQAFIVTLYDPTFGGTISISSANNSFLSSSASLSSFPAMGGTFQRATAGSFGPVCGPGGCC